MTEPLVSIVIPHFERSGLLRQAVASVLQSSEERFEVIVVDDGSSPAEWRAIQSLRSDRVQVIRRSDGLKGPSRCRNLGVAASRSEFIVFLDSDDVMAGWCLRSRLTAAMQAPDADCWVFPVLLFSDVPGDGDRLWNRMITGEDDAMRFARSDSPWHTSSPLWRKTSLTSLGGFNETVFYGDDSDLHLRALLSGVAVRQYPDAIPDIFVRRSSVSRITNSLDDAVVESRRVRLREGTRFLRSRENATPYLRTWEGQYFTEGEFLLFNHRDATEPVRKVLEDWETAFAPSPTLRRTVHAYFATALACRHKTYLLLRIARRLAMQLLPPEFFPRGESEHQATVPPNLIKEVQNRIHAQVR